MRIFVPKNPKIIEYFWHSSANQKGDLVLVLLYDRKK